MPADASANASDPVAAATSELVTLREPGGGVARITAHGAHVLEWRPEAGAHNQLFLSADSAFGADASIRGGIPVIFPQFGEFGELPKHGFARRSAWQLLAVDEASATFALSERPATLDIWPHPFSLNLTVSLRASELRCLLTVENTGDDAFQFTAGLHTYLRVAAIDTVALEGLGGRTYWDATRGMAEAIQAEDELRFGPELDRVYPNVLHAVTMTDGPRRLRIEAEGFQDVVVWNPGADKAAAMSDMEPGGEQRMLCVEAAQIDNPVSLGPGARWQGAQMLTV